jgi:flagellar hook-associated protein 2
MVNPTFSVGGISSGLDTAGIIDQLVALERQPIVRYQRQQADLRARDDAWGTVVSRLSGLRTALDEVRDRDTLRGLVTTTSSNESAVEVTSNGAGSPGNFDFTVSQLATRHRVGLSGSFATSTTPVGAGTITLTDETNAVIGEITTDASTTLLSLSRQIDDLELGIDAQVLKVGEGDYQLVLTSRESGEEGVFGVSTDVADLGAAATLETGVDAILQLGTLEIRRSSNLIDDLVEGATLKLKATTTDDVSINVEQDLESAVESVQALVDGFNSVLEQLKSLTRYDPETGAAGVLQGDSFARDLSFDLRSSLTELTGADGDAFRYAGDLGIELTQQGLVELDVARLREALTDDYAGAVGFLSQTLTGDAGVDISFVGDGATSGAIALNVSQSATIASATGATLVNPGPPFQFTITTADGTDVAVSVDADSTAAQAVARINAALGAAEQTGLQATVGGAGNDAITLSTSGYGSAATFTVSGYGVDLDGTYSGQDVVADFGLGNVTGSGQSIVGNGAGAGITMRVTGGVGAYNLAFSDGIGGVIDRFVSGLEGSTGRIQTARDALDSSIRDFDEQIERFEQRVAIRETTLRLKFTNLESTLGTLQAQGNYLASSLSSLNVN